MSYGAGIDDELDGLDIEDEEDELDKYEEKKTTSPSKKASTKKETPSKKRGKDGKPKEEAKKGKGGKDAGKGGNARGGKKEETHMGGDANKKAAPEKLVFMDIKETKIKAEEYMLRHNRPYSVQDILNCYQSTMRRK